MFSSRAFQGAQGKTPTEARSLLTRKRPALQFLPAARGGRCRVLGFSGSGNLAAESRGRLRRHRVLEAQNLARIRPRGSAARREPEHENPRIPDPEIPAPGAPAPGASSPRVRPPSPAASDKEDPAHEEKTKTIPSTTTLPTTNRRTNMASFGQGLGSLPPVILKIKPSTLVAANGNVYDAVKIAWKINRSNAAGRAVLAVEKKTGKILEVFTVIRWRSAGGGRYRFSGSPDAAPAARRLVGKRIPARYRGPHEANPVRYIR